MDDDDIDDLLVSQGYGILSLCREGEPYSIPVSFGYDGDHVYFGLLEDGPEPTKMRFVEEGSTARLLATDIRGRFDWQSVAVSGPIRLLDPDDEAEWEHFVGVMEDNAWFMRSFERSDAVESVQAWELQTEDLRGLERKEEVYE
jgi:nitroimidazol reductase NimA-like FMN-containing flavoprotein (pyridoxamine 5'-phosphate oxidase superfamily)